jgi:hypothetical protein
VLTVKKAECPHCHQFLNVEDNPDFPLTLEELREKAEDNCHCTQGYKARRTKAAAKCVRNAFKDDVRAPFKPVPADTLDLLLAVGNAMAHGFIDGAAVKLSNVENAVFKNNKDDKVEVTRKRTETEERAF